MKEIIINSEKNGVKTILVDDEDYEFLNQWKWNASKSRNTFYAIRKTGNRGKTISMHRLILNLKDSKTLVDHKDHNGLNNQRNNLRIATQSQNCSNKVSHKNSSSKYLGVNWNKAEQKWRAEIRKNYKATFLGYFDNEEQAAKAYNNAAIKIHGEFYNLNKITA